MYNPIILPPECQADVLHDRDAKGRERPWQQHKAAGQLLAVAYDLSGDAARASRLRSCADSLAYSRDDAGQLHLQSAAFCRVRLCPICQWRRSLKVYGQTIEIVRYLAEQRAAEGLKPYAYLMLTLTVPNVPGDKLSAEITTIHKAWQRIMQRANVRAAVRGWMRGTEVTRNAQTGQYHHHIHAVLAVLPSYFTGRQYISRDKWLLMWQEATRDKSITQVDIRRCYGSAEAAAAEISKYTAKVTDYVTPDDVDTMQRTVEELDKALAHRRFVAWGGCMRDAHAALQLDDAEDGDLLHIGDDATAVEQEAPALIWDWVPGPRVYLRRK